MKILPRSLRFLSTLALFGVASALQAQSPQNPFPISGPTTITAPGYYRLTKNIFSSATTGHIITINSHNVTIDFNSFFIVGPNNPANTVIGVYANEFGNLTIKNGSIAFCQVGVELTGNNNPSTTRNINHIIDNMRITNCWNYGVYFPASSPGSVVSNCQFSQIGGSTAGTLGDGIGVFGAISDKSVLVKDNVFNKLVGNNGDVTRGFGIAYTIAVRNAIANSDTGVYSGKYQNNLTINVTTAVTAGIDAGGNN
jgi:hypothetical protein